MHRIQKQTLKIVLAGCILLLMNFPVSAKETYRQWLNEATEHYVQGHYDEARALYRKILSKDPEHSAANYGLGTLAAKEEDLAQAEIHLLKSLLTENEALRFKAHYNLGTNYVRFGLQEENRQIVRAVELMHKAVDQLEKAVLMNDKDDDARYNYEIAWQELERLIQKQQQKQQQQQGGQQQNNQSEENKQQDEQNKENQQKQQGSKDGKDEEEGDSSGSNSQSPSSQDSSSEQESSTPPGEEGEQQPDTESRNQFGDDEGQMDEDEISPAGKSDDAKPGEDSSEQTKGVQPGRILPGEMTPFEAKMLLDTYQQTEEPQGLLNFIKRKGKETPVLKDW